MKKTQFDGKQWILELLNESNIKTVISGKVYKNRRPTGSNVEDVVINALTVDNSFLQDGVYNVNFYVPYQQLSINGITQYMPNESRMKAITDLAYPLFDDVFRSQFNLTVVRIEVFEEDVEKASYVNFRINIKAYNNLK